MTSHNPLLPLIGRGISADVAAGHAMVPGVVRARTPLGVNSGVAPTYDVDISGPGGRTHRLVDITGSVYCQVGHTVWVGLPYGDYHRSATILARQLPGLPRQYDVDGGGLTHIAFLGHPQTYAISAEVEISDPTTRRWTEPVTQLTASVDLNVLGALARIVWHAAPVPLSGSPRPDLEVEIPFITTALATTSAGDPPHGHQIDTHEHDSGPLEISDGFDGPFSARFDVHGTLQISDYLIYLGSLDPDEFDDAQRLLHAESMAVRVRVSAPAPATATLRSAHIVEIGVYTG